MHDSYALSMPYFTFDSISLMFFMKSDLHPIIPTNLINLLNHRESFFILQQCINHFDHSFKSGTDMKLVNRKEFKNVSYKISIIPGDEILMQKRKIRILF